MTGGKRWRRVAWAMLGGAYVGYGVGAVAHRLSIIYGHHPGQVGSAGELAFAVSVFVVGVFFIFYE